ncbi:hypothetical protein TSTA_089880 [Talaromyces stipitatus ATCC 10500]|uniref:Uncharacterized protein n=1 Tax=Talaromyces stipitatus (strain ATCC 10500 / CBS 375.48 / QM 6759 / NRRL 1006) TaxID=441959 RepID=B8M0W9_TALSN|nr:uncharacterized protein TSTA_089880 [Talaromyces stipitatus ATCC 10500]EED21749.1 hypothetical protein TSTA_089880 [Talaromyces stipitatus ATCC 10500]
MSRNELLITQKEVHDLRAANEKEKKKRKRSRAQISHEGSLTAQEAQELIGSRNEASQPIPTAPLNHAYERHRSAVGVELSGIKLIDVQIVLLVKKLARFPEKVIGWVSDYVISRDN